jgi:hypothetical protein
MDNAAILALARKEASSLGADEDKIVRYIQSIVISSTPAFFDILLQVLHVLGVKQKDAILVRLLRESREDLCKVHEECDWLRARVHAAEAEPLPKRQRCDNDAASADDDESPPVPASLPLEPGNIVEAVSRDGPSWYGVVDDRQPSVVRVLRLKGKRKVVVSPNGKVETVGSPIEFEWHEGAYLSKEDPSYLLAAPEVKVHASCPIVL